MIAWFRVFGGAMVVAAMVGVAATSAFAAPPVVPDKHNPGTGQGYWVYACDAAARAGYTGDLNKSFSPYVIDHDQWVNTPELQQKTQKDPQEIPGAAGAMAATVGPSVDRYEIDSTSDPAHPRFYKVNQAFQVRAWVSPFKWMSEWGGNAPDLNDHIEMWDQCSVGGSSLGVRRRTDPSVRDKAIRRFQFFKLSLGDDSYKLAFGDIGAGWRFTLPKDVGASKLVIERFRVEDRIHSVKTAQPECDRGGTDFKAKLGVLCGWAPGTQYARPGWGAGWSIVRDLADDRGTDQFRFCQPHGTWTDARISSAWGKNVSVGAPDPGGLWNDYNYSTKSYGSAARPYFRKGSGEYDGMMTGSGPVSDPDARCGISGGREWYYSDPGNKAYSIKALISCYRSMPSRAACRAINDEPATARANFIDWGVRARVDGATVFVRDLEPPTVTITGGSLNRNGGVANDGTINAENLTYTASDNAGIRRIRVTIDGPGVSYVYRDESNLTVDGDVCDYRYPIPCAGATAGRNELKPAWAPGVAERMFAPILENADDLRPGSYVISITAWDASNQQSPTAQARFRVDQNLRVDCRGAIVQTGTPEATCGSRSIPPSTAYAPTPAASTSTAPPVTGRSIFSYTLLRPISTSSTNTGVSQCVTDTNVIRGSGSGGSLSDPELNMITAVTLDLSVLAPRGTSVGTQQFRTTFDLPSRQDTTYRAALGCSQ